MNKKENAFKILKPEHALIVKFEDIQIFPINLLEDYEEENVYHLYSIMTTNRLFFDKDSLKISTSGISCNLIEIYYGREIVHEVINLELGNFDHQLIDISTFFPYDFLVIDVNDPDFINNVNEKRIEKEQDAVREIRYRLFTQTIFNLAFKDKETRFRLEYIGQSYGKNGKNTAQKRLNNHATFQTILKECITKYTDKYIYILMANISHELDIVWPLDYFESLEKYMKNDIEVRELDYDNKEIINITEAALIHYFKPYYNVHYKNQFPSNKHKAYMKIKKADFESIIIDFNFEFDNINPYIFYTDNIILDPFLDDIHYRLHDNVDRIDMYKLYEPI